MAINSGEICAQKDSSQAQCLVIYRENIIFLEEEDEVGGTFVIPGEIKVQKMLGELCFMDDAVNNGHKSIDEESDRDLQKVETVWELGATRKESFSHQEQRINA